MISVPCRFHHGDAWRGMSTNRSGMLRRLRVFEMCRAACRLSMRRRRMLWGLRVLGMCRAACCVSTRLSSRLCFITARDKRQCHATKNN
jgi:hypothetical protein